MSQQILWKTEIFSKLTAAEIYKILQLRLEVFVVEESYPCRDIDGIDMEDSTLHVFGEADSKIVAYGRVYIEHESVYISRVVCAKAIRGTGCSNVLLANLITAAKTLRKPIYISARAYLRHWYENFGFEAISEDYTKDGVPVPLVDMHIASDSAPVTVI